MYIKKIFIQSLLENVPLRKRLAKTLNVTERAIFNLAKKYVNGPTPNSLFTRIAVLEFFKNEGFKEEELLTEDISAI